VTLAPFTDAHRSKGAPNSLVESLACGRPVVATEIVGLAELIREGNAGIICRATGEELAASLDALSKDWETYSRSARTLAENRFCVERFLGEYNRLYTEVLGG
jgi:glycosyltransferase involved in cell wall biosynthesis